MKNEILEKLKKRFKLNTEAYDKDLIEFVDFFCKEMAKPVEGYTLENAEAIMYAMKPAYLVFGRALLVFLFSVGGDAKRLGELQIKQPEEVGEKRIVENL